MLDAANLRPFTLPARIVVMPSRPSKLALDTALENVLLDECAGFYDGVRGVVFLDVVDSATHFMTDFHEGTHRWLAENSTLGTLYRFFALVRDRVADELDPEPLRQIDLLLHELKRSSILPQEVGATYLALYVGQRYFPAETRATLASMPPRLLENASYSASTHLHLSNTPNQRTTVTI